MTLEEFTSLVKKAVEKFKKDGLGLRSLYDLVEAVVLAIEEFKDENFLGQDKKQAALDLIEEIWDLTGADIPVLSNKMEKRILRFFCGILIDVIVAKFNKESWPK